MSPTSERITNKQVLGWTIAILVTIASLSGTGFLAIAGDMREDIESNKASIGAARESLSSINASLKFIEITLSKIDDKVGKLQTSQSAMGAKVEMHHKSVHSRK